MARLIPTLIFFFYLSIVLSSSHARSPAASPEDDVINLPPLTYHQQDASELKSNIVLPTDKVLDSDPASAVNVDVVGEENRPKSGKFSDEFQEKDMPALESFDDGEKRLEKEFPARGNRRPMNRHLDRMRCKCPLHCHHRGPRFDGGPQIRPQRIPIWRERNDVVEDNEHQHHHHDRHGEIISARWIDWPRSHQVDPERFPDVDGDKMMIGEFKQPHFFFHRHHHHHHRHHRDDEEEMEHEEREHHGYGKGHGFLKPFRKFLNHF